MHPEHQQRLRGATARRFYARRFSRPDAAVLASRSDALWVCETSEPLVQPAVPCARIRSCEQMPLENRERGAVLVRLRVWASDKDVTGELVKSHHEQRKFQELAVSAEIAILRHYPPIHQQVWQST